MTVGIDDREHWLGGDMLGQKIEGGACGLHTCQRVHDDPARAGIDE
jgi:hypothetical protein